MKKLLFSVLLILLFSCSVMAGTPEYPEYVEGEVLVVIDAPDAASYSVMGAYNENVYSQAVSNRAEAFAKTRGLESRSTYSEIARVSKKNIIHLRSRNKKTDQLIRELSSDINVISVQPNYITKLNRVPNDEYYPWLWGMENIGAPKVWDFVTGSDSVVVAVIDTGIDYNHQDINANMARDSYGYYGRRFHKNGSESSDPMDIDDHGTHVAGTIGAVGNNGIGVAGVCWKVKLLAVNNFTEGAGSKGRPGAYDKDTINGINYLVSEKRKGLNIRAANMSLGGWRSPQSNNTAYGLAIKSLSDAGIICVMSAGNDNQNINNPTGVDENGNSVNGKRHYPSSFRFDNTISVGAIDSNNKRCYFSNYGYSWVDIAAPGDWIYSTTPNNQYGYMKGTSMSAPHVTGAVALLCAAYPNETATQIKARVLSKAKYIGVSDGL